MRLEVNSHTAADNANALSIKYTVGDLHPETETSIRLHDSEGIYLEANGVPKRGFTLYYTNAITRVEYASKNKRLKPRAVMRVMRHYLAGDALWRVDIAWLPLTEEAVAEQKLNLRRQPQPFILLLMLFFFAYVSLLLVVLFALPQLLLLLTILVALVGWLVWQRRAAGRVNQ
ncbi:MAG: hypothetical protein ABI835_06900 [Chloroflexota bacterium]